MAHETNIVLLADPQEGSVNVVTDRHDAYSAYSSIRQLADSGWTLLAILQEKGAETIGVTKNDPQGYSHTDEEIAEITITKYVFRENPESTLAKVAAERDEKAFALSTAEDKIVELQKKVEEETKDLKAQCERQATALDNAERTIKENAEELDELRTTLETVTKARDEAVERLEKLEKLQHVDDFGHQHGHEDVVRTAIATMNGSLNSIDGDTDV
jgi:hypothetical protein